MHYTLTTELAREHTARRITEATRFRTGQQANSPAAGNRSRRRWVGRLAGATTGPARLALGTSNR